MFVSSFALSTAAEVAAGKLAGNMHAAQQQQH
jgi:hypothetical protein